VTSTGTLATDEGSQNVSAAHLANGTGDIYCLTVASQPHNGVASVDVGSSGQGFATVLARQLSTSEIAFWAGKGCAGTTNALVSTFDTTGAAQPEPFFVAFFG
jgi:hypothetical protein